MVKPERVNLEIFADVPNILNHSNYLLIGNRYGNQGVFTNTLQTVSGVTSYSVNPSFGDTNGGGGTRQINLGIALMF